MPIDPEDFEEYLKVKPLIRSLAAFALHLRFGVPDPDRTHQQPFWFNDAYEVADLFLAQLEEDMKK